MLAWADAHHARTGRWPTVSSGKVYERTARELATDRQRAHARIPRVPRRLVAATAVIRGSAEPNLVDNARGSQFARSSNGQTTTMFATGPGRTAARALFRAQVGVTWATVNKSLRKSEWLPREQRRLDRLLAKRRMPSRRSTADGSDDRSDSEMGRHLLRRQGPMAEQRSLVALRNAPGLSWRIIDDALRHGLRGLPGGMSLAQVLEEGGRGAGNPELDRRS